MATLACVHAHPDDEAIFTGALLCAARAAGWRTVVIVATDGAEGQMPEWVRADAGAHRWAELCDSAEALGVDAVHSLGYRDSGMAGTPANSAPGSLSAADPRAVADVLAEIFARENVTAASSYDANGIYGHPDHVAVHDATAAAAAKAGIAEILEATLDRGELLALRHTLIGSGRLDPGVWDPEGIEGLGVQDRDGRRIVHVDAGAWWASKQAAMAAHASQVPHIASLLGIPPGVAHRVLSQEWFLARGGPGPLEIAVTA